MAHRLVALLLTGVLAAGCGDATPDPNAVAGNNGIADVGDDDARDDPDDSGQDLEVHDTDPADVRDNADGSDAAPDLDPDPDVPGNADADGGDEPGSWDNPVRITALPFRFDGDTRAAPSHSADQYACAPETNEGGGEFVFVYAPPAPVRLRIAVDDVRGDATDIDVHLLSAADPASCTARNDVSLEAEVSAEVHIVADTWVNGQGDVLAGPFVLTVAQAQPPEPGDCLTNPIECDENDLPTPNGVPEEPVGLRECPAGMAPVAGFCVDRWEAALVTVNPPGPWSPYAHPGDTEVRAVSAPGLVPQGYITGRQAAAACDNAGKRLCTDDEWLRACQGAAGQTFPYGAAHEPGRCNEGRTCHPVVQYFETGADWIWSELGHPCINQLPDGLAPTGSHPDCTSDDGIFDMHGNLHEWTSNPTGIFRGGFYVDASINGPGCLYRTTAHSVGHWDYSTGFRCCAD